MAHQIYAAIADGILGGGVYALMAVGLTLIFGVLAALVIVLTVRPSGLFGQRAVRAQ